MLYGWLLGQGRQNHIAFPGAKKKATLAKAAASPRRQRSGELSLPQGLLGVPFLGSVAARGGAINDLPRVLVVCVEKPSRTEILKQHTQKKTKSRRTD